ncbi:hypothetical protein JKP88DRAFT_353630 [Tribonema minus]|uniref:Uncharacterized protein n=1 Tax=Tribonema minus TaxID=303371 RepID=A0A835Z651_9STRA|nr:hypothetical protein JKP88DRAFT_353630 [Tribonema minus]
MPRAPDSVNAADLQQRILDLRTREARRSKERTAEQSAEDAVMSEQKSAEDAMMSEQKALMKRMRSAFVLIFNPGQASEGIYTLWVNNQNIVLGFESRQEAVRYALMLKAQEFHSPSPQELKLAELKQFCRESGVGLKLVPKGSGLTPPEANKTDVDSLRQRFNQLYSSPDDAW